METAISQKANDEIDFIIKLITEIRVLKAEMNIPPAKLIPVLVKDIDQKHYQIIEQWSDAIGRMARVQSIAKLQNEIPSGSIQTIIDDTILVLPLQGIIDIKKEKERLTKEIEKIALEIEQLNKKLSNQNFLSKARPEIVEENRERLKQLVKSEKRFKTALLHLN